MGWQLILGMVPKSQSKISKSPASDDGNFSASDSAKWTSRKCCPVTYSSVFTGIPRNSLSYWFIQCCRYRELQLLSIKYLNEWTGWRWITGAHRPKVRSWPPSFRTWFRTFKLSIVCFVNFLIKNWWKIRFLVSENAICVFINLIKYFVILNILTQLWIRMRFIYRDNSDRVVYINTSFKNTLATKAS